MSLGFHEFNFTAMGSSGQIRLYATTQREATAVASAMMSEIARIEARYSRFLPESSLSRLNDVAHMGGTATVDAETAGILDYAFSCYRKSDGLFDITAGCLRRAWNFSVAELPDGDTIEEILACVGLDKLRWETPKLTFLRPGMELDFGGICKEYAVDRAAEIAMNHGLEYGLIDLGGDIRAIGPQGDGSPWDIGICHPREPDILAACLSISHGAVATSGDYERYIDVEGRRYSHLLDPRTGWPVHGLSAVTVMADSCLVAGCVTTIAMLKGNAGADWLGGLNLPYLWIDAEGRQGRDALPLKDGA